MERLVFKILGVIQIIAGISIVGISGRLVQGDHQYYAATVNYAGFIIIGLVIFANGVIGLATVNKWMDVIYLVASGVGSTAATAMIWMSASLVHGYNSAGLINSSFGLFVGLLVCSIFSCIASLAGTSIMAATICRHYSA